MPIEKSDIKSLTLDEEEQIREHIKEFSSFYDKINKRNSEAIWEAWEKSEALLKKQSQVIKQTVKINGFIIGENLAMIPNPGEVWKVTRKNTEGREIELIKRPTVVISKNCINSSNPISCPITDYMDKHNNVRKKHPDYSIHISACDDISEGYILYGQTSTFFPDELKEKQNRLLFQTDPSLKSQLFDKVYNIVNEKEEYLFFCADNDFQNISSFVKQIQDSKNPISLYLKSKFSIETKRKLHHKVNSRILQRLIIDDLNSFLYDENLYNNIKDFVELSSATKVLNQQCLSKKDTVLFNRLVIEESYPNSFKKHLYHGAIVRAKFGWGESYECIIISNTLYNRCNLSGFIIVFQTQDYEKCHENKNPLVVFKHGKYGFTRTRTLSPYTICTIDKLSRVEEAFNPKILGYINSVKINDIIKNLLQVLCRQSILENTMINKSDIKPLTPEEEKMIEGHIKEFSGFYNKINKRNSEVIWETWNKNDNFYLQFAKDYSKKEHSIKFKGLIVINGEEVQVQQETWAKNMDECFFEKTLSRVLNLATELTGQISAQLILECSPREKRLYIRTNNIGDKLLYDLYLLITFSNNTTQFLCGRDIVELGKWQVNIEKKEISTIELIVDKSSFDKKNLNNLLENSSEILIKNYKLISITQEIFSLSTMAEEKNEIEIEQEIVQNNNDWGQIKIKCSWESNMVLIEEFEHLNSPLPGEIAYFIEFCDTKTQEAFSEMIKIDPFKIPESGIFLDKKQIQFNPLETDWLLLLSMIKTK